MALSQPALKTSLLNFVNSIDSASPTTKDAACEALATAIHDYVSDAVVNIAIGAIVIPAAPGANTAPVVGTLS